MSAPEFAVLSREARGIRIPEGQPTRLAAGARVRISQSLGGTYTVLTDRGEMIRLDDRDADAIGKSAPAVDPSLSEGTLEEQVWSRLRTCYDPEIPVNVVDLGLIYSCDLAAASSGGTDVRVLMTLTAPGCGMGPVLADDVKRKLETLPDVAGVAVELVWDPPWNQGMMTEAARLELGLL